MREYIVQRALSAAEYTLDNHSTVRETAKALKVSKSTVHTDLAYRLPKINPQLASKVRGVLMANKLLFRRRKDAERKKV